MTKKGIVDWLVKRIWARKALTKRDFYHVAVQWLQAGCCKWNREAKTYHKFQQFVKKLQKLQREMKLPTGNRNKSIQVVKNDSSSLLLE